MKVALEFGEALEVALLENNRVVGSLSLVLRGAGAAPRVAAAPAAKAAAAPAAKAGRKRRQLSPEARARMAAAQKERWAKKRASEGNPSSEQ